MVPGMVPGMAPGTNPGDYLDVKFETAVVEVFRYQYGKPLVKDGSPPLTTMMQKLHDWYMKTCSESRKDVLSIGIKEEHDFVGLDLISVEFDELFQLYNQKDLDKSILASYCL
jgi:hypothetical protein